MTAPEATPSSTRAGGSSLRRQARWLAPVAVAGVVAAGFGLPRLADASSAVDRLPERSAAELLTAVSNASVPGMSGTIVSTSRLGLPALPTAAAGGGGGAVSLQSLAAGSTTARVWTSGTDRQRIAVDAPFAEYDVVRDGATAWTYDSASSDVTRMALPADPSAGAEAMPSQAAVTPQAAADAVLAMITPTTKVSVGSSAMVAGRAAYELVLTPQDTGTLVRSVRLAVDGQTSMPLRMQAFGTGQVEPAIEVGYTSVRFQSPDASVFAFTPPAGSTVTDKDLSTMGSESSAKATPEAGSSVAPTVLGQGWTSVVEAKGVTVPADAKALVAQLSTPVEGGRVISSALVSVLLTDDGRVLVGAVPPQRLVTLAGR